MKGSLVLQKRFASTAEPKTSNRPASRDIARPANEFREHNPQLPRFLRSKLQEKARLLRR
ncbi:hypothetical protein [Pseudomonas phage vB_Pa-PAC1]